MIENIVPNIGIKIRNHPRLGRLCEVQYPDNRARAMVRNIKNNFITVIGPKLFNCLLIKYGR